MASHEQIRTAILSSLEATRQEYFELLDSIPDDLWNTPVNPPKWKFGQLMAHMEMSLSFVIPKTVAASLRGKKQAIPVFRPSIANPLNLLMTRLFALGANKQGLKEKYEKNNRKLIALLDTIGPGDWGKATSFPGGHLTIEQQFLSHRQHFLHHAVQIRSALSRHRQN